MALIKCPDCGNMFSEFADGCPQCGCPVASIDRQSSPHSILPMVPPPLPMTPTASPVTPPSPPSPTSPPSSPSSSISTSAIKKEGTGGAYIVRPNPSLRRREKPKEDSEPKEVQQKQKNKKKWLVVLIVVLSLLLLGAIGYLAYYLLNKDKVAYSPVTFPLQEKTTSKHSDGDNFYSEYEDVSSESYSTSSSSYDITSEYSTVRITGADLRLRLGPSTSAGTLQYEDSYNIHPTKGDYLELLGEEQDFYRVMYKGNIVYVSKDYATPSNSSPYIKSPTVVVITGNNVVMRQGAGMEYSAVTDYNGYNIILKKWSTYKYVNSVDNFYQINYNGSYYYVSKYDSHPV